MQLLKLKCNNCGALLEIDLNHLQAFCPYCGQKLMIDFDQLALVLTEREITKRSINHEEQQTRRTQMAYEHESREKDKDWKKSVIAFIGLVIVMSCLSYPMFIGPRYKHEKKIAYLQQLEIKIEEEIEAGNYDSALLTANKLYCDDNYSEQETAVWDAKRESYVKIIEEKKYESDLKNPNNIFMPCASDSFSGKHYEEVVDQLRALGFTCITVQSAVEPAGLFHKKDTVEHILIGGKTDFTTQDYFDKDTIIIVYYYAKTPD